MGILIIFVDAFLLIGYVCCTIPTSTCKVATWKQKQKDTKSNQGHSKEKTTSWLSLSSDQEWPLLLRLLYQGSEIATPDGQQTWIRLVG